MKTNKSYTSNPNRQKSNKLSSSDGTSQDANLKRPTKAISLTHYESSSGANPIIHECPMYRKKPLSKVEAERELKKQGVIKNGN